MGEGFVSKSKLQYTPPDWATGTDAQIVEAINKDRAGEINLRDYWSVGDTRTVNLSAMGAMAGEEKTEQVTGYIRIRYYQSVYRAYYTTTKPTLNTSTGYYTVSSVTNGSYCRWDNTNNKVYRSSGSATYYVPLYETSSGGNVVGYMTINSSTGVSGTCNGSLPASGSNAYVSFTMSQVTHYASGLSDTHAAQSVELVLMDNVCTGFTWAETPDSGVTVPRFIVGMKDSLNETGAMNATDTNAGGWKDCLRRTWCNTIYKNAFPSTLIDIFKEFSWKQGVGGGASSGLNTTTDMFALAPEKTIFGTIRYSFTDEAALYSNWVWYQTSSNREKKVNGSARYWWECSPHTGYSYYFCDANLTGSASDGATTNIGLSPFGCI